MEINQDRLAQAVAHKARIARPIAPGLTKDQMMAAIRTTLEGVGVDVPEIPADCLDKQVAWLSVPKTFDLSPWSQLQKRVRRWDNEYNFLHFTGREFMNENLNLFNFDAEHMHTQYMQDCAHELGFLVWPNEGNEIKVGAKEHVRSIYRKAAQAFFDPRQSTPFNFKPEECRALVALREVITEPEYRRYLKRKFIVEKDGNRTYIIYRDDSVYVYENGKPLTSLCCHTNGVPPTDRVLAFLVMIRSGEDLFALSNDKGWPLDREEKHVMPDGNSFRELYKTKRDLFLLYKRFSNDFVSAFRRGLQGITILTEHGPVSANFH